MFFDNFKAICDKKGLKPNPVAQACGASNNSATKWKKGSSPNSEIVVKLANYLNVSTDYLLLGSEAKAIVLSDDERSLLDNYTQLSDKNKARILERIQVMLETEAENL